MSWTSMFKWATFREILLPSSGNVNDYVAHISSKYADLYGNNKTYGSEKCETWHIFVWSNQFDQILKN